MHVACASPGNSAPVATRHYLQMRNEYFMEAANRGEKCGALLAKNAAHSWRRMPPGLYPLSSAMIAKITRQLLVSKGLEPMLADDGISFPNYPVPPEGLEPSTH